MSDKEFGIKFTKTDHGFKIEANGNEEMLKAHHEMAEACRGFMDKAREVAKTHYQHHHDHHHEHEGCNHDVKKEPTDTDLKTE